MLEYGGGGVPGTTGHHGAGGTFQPGGDGLQLETESDGWEATIVETIADRGEGVEELLDVLEDHQSYLDESGERDSKTRTRYAEEIRTLVREDVNELLAEEIERRGGLDRYVTQVLDRETDPYAVSDELVGPLAECVQEKRDS
jgi:LAO/AO transport system kinase